MARQRRRTEAIHFAMPRKVAGGEAMQQRAAHAARKGVRGMQCRVQCSHGSGKYGGAEAGRAIALPPVLPACSARAYARGVAVR